MENLKKPIFIALFVSILLAFCYLLMKTYKISNKADSNLSYIK